jgi:hypothetical protein
MVDKNNSGDEAGPVTALERALAGLKPSRSQIDRDRFLFLAGKVAAESERRPSRFMAWAWPASTFLSAGAALVLLMLLVWRPPTSTSGAVSFRPAIDRSSTVASSIDSARSRSVVANRQANSANNGPVTGELETGTSEPSLADAADLDSSEPFNSLRLRYDRIASKGNAVAQPRPVSRGPLAPSPIEAPRTQRELLREFLEADRLAQASPENQAG